MTEIPAASFGRKTSAQETGRLLQAKTRWSGVCCWVRRHGHGRDNEEHASASVVPCLAQVPAVRCRSMNMTWPIEKLSPSLQNGSGCMAVSAVAWGIR